MSFLEKLTLILVVAKLFGLINISWFWVFSPILIPVLIITIIVILGALND